MLKKLSIPDQGVFFKDLFPDPDEYTSLIFVPNVVVMRRQMWTEVENAINGKVLSFILNNNAFFVII